MRNQQITDWSVPQRQPPAALFIMIIQTFWEIIKRAWPIFLIPLLRGGEAATRLGKFEFYGIVILALTLAGGFLKYFFFRFYILEDEVIVKKGWLKKQTIVIPLNKIQTVNLEQPLIHQALNLVKVTIDTPGSTNTEVTIDSLRKPMAEDLRRTLMEQKPELQTEEEEKPAMPVVPLLQISSNDLVRLSLSANHLETFFVILAFGLSLYDNISQVSEGWIKAAEGYVPQQTFGIMLFIAVAGLLITIMISTIRIILKFYNLSVYRAANGFRIASGLTTIKERVVSTRKVQYVSWRASWVRELFKLKLFRFHLSGDEDMKEALKAELPVTRPEYLELLTGDYYKIPATTGMYAIRIHPVYVLRQFLFLGLLPAMIVAAITWQWLEERSLLFFLFSLVILLFAWLHARKFRLWAFDEIMFMQQGFFGKKETMLKWYKLQSVSLSQSIYQRRKGLATMNLVTAGGRITIRYIPLDAARQVVNYALYKIESTREPWM